MRIDASPINRSDARARDRRNGETPVLAARCQQLHGIADAGLKCFRQPRTKDDRAGVISKIIKVAFDELVEKIGRLRMERGLDSVKVDSRIFKSSARAHSPSQNGRTGNHVGKLPAHRSEE